MPLPGGQVLVGAACLLFVVVAFGSAAPCFKVVDVPPLVRTSWRIQVRQAAGGGGACAPAALRRCTHESHLASGRCLGEGPRKGD